MPEQLQALQQDKALLTKSTTPVAATVVITDTSCKVKPALKRGFFDAKSIKKTTGSQMRKLSPSQPQVKVRLVDITCRQHGSQASTCVTD